MSVGSPAWTSGSRPLGARIVVPVVRPASLDSLLPVAAAMALADDGHVVPVTVVAQRASSADIRAASTVAADAERRLHREGVSATGVVAEAAQVAEGVRAVVASESATLVIMGWRGSPDPSQAFNTTVDNVVGRSSVPLLVVRTSDVEVTRIVLPLTADHVTAGARRGLELATTLARRLALQGDLGVSVLWAGDTTPQVPGPVRALSDRLHNDPRPLDRAVGAMSRAGDVVVTSVPPTPTGLRDITTHVTAATPDAALIVAIDPGPGAGQRGLGRQVADAVHVRLDGDGPADHIVTVIIDPPPDSTLTRRGVVRALTHLGTVSDVQAQWRATTGDRRLRVEVRLATTGATQAIGAVMAELHGTPALAGATLQYEVEPAADPIRVDHLEVFGSMDD
jgi:hypothetical protein